MTRSFRSSLGIALLPAIVCVLLGWAGTARAEVTRVEIQSRADVLGGRAFGAAGAYEQIRGRIYFAVDPTNPRNAQVADITLAPKNAAGKVEFSADLWIVTPKDPARRNGTAIVEVVNRGSRLIFARIVRGAASAAFTTDSEFGDGELLRDGYTMAWVGWQFDVVPGDNRMRLYPPVAPGTSGRVGTTFVPADRMTPVEADALAGYRPADEASSDNALTLLSGGPGSNGTLIPRNRWHLHGNTVSVDGGFEPGRTYEVSYIAHDAPLAGLGLVAVRDIASWLKYAPTALVSAQRALAFGVSQSGRFLRTFLYQGFNADERERRVYDGVMAHIAGASRIDINRRWATPTSQGQYDATAFPFANAEMTDPVTGARDGLLENSRARGFEPRIFYTNTGVEYWGGARSAALIHTTPDGLKDVAPPDNVRIYFLAGSQHGPSAFPPAQTLGQHEQNPNDYYWMFRALVPAMDRWVRTGATPPASRYPRLADGTLVEIAQFRFPAIPRTAAPGAAVTGVRIENPALSRRGAPGTPLPLLVPTVDADGNERAGVRLPEVAVPVATYTG